MGDTKAATRFNFEPYLDFLFMNLLHGKEEEDHPFKRSRRILIHALYQDCPRDVSRYEKRFIARNLAHLVQAFPDKGRKTGGMDERHYFLVAKRLAAWGADKETIASGLCHDYTEDKLEEEQGDDGDDAEIAIRSIGEDLQDLLRWNLTASYPVAELEGIDAAHRARRLVAINYKLTRNPKNSYLDSMQHLLFPIQGIFTLDDIVLDLERHGMPGVAHRLREDAAATANADLSRRELEYVIACYARQGRVAIGEASRAQQHLTRQYRAAYNITDILRVMLVKCADRLDNGDSHEAIEQRTTIPPGSITRHDKEQIVWLRELLHDDPLHAKARLFGFNAAHQATLLETHQIAYSVAKTHLFSQVAKLFFLYHFGNDWPHAVQEQHPTVYQAYRELIERTRFQIDAARGRLTDTVERSRHDHEVREYEEAGYLDVVTHRQGGTDDDLRGGYYGLHGTLDQYRTWMERNKADMNLHRQRPMRVDLDLAAFDRMLEKMLEDPHYFVHGYTERAEKQLYERRPEMSPVGKIGESP